MRPACGCRRARAWEKSVLTAVTAPPGPPHSPADPSLKSATSWYALAVHRRSEAPAAAALQGVADEVFLPARRIRRVWSDRVKIVEEPLFPGYLFVRTALSSARRVELLKVRQVYDLVGRIPGDERIAHAVPHHEIDAVRAVIQADRSVEPVGRLVAGTVVRVVSGPLRGVRGRVERGPNGQQRLVVQVELLGRGVRTALDANDVIEDAGEG